MVLAVFNSSLQFVASVFFIFPAFPYELGNALPIFALTVVVACIMAQVPFKKVMTQTTERLLWKPHEITLPEVGACHLYIPKVDDDSSEAEWSVKDVTGMIWTSGDPSKRYSRWKSHQERVANLYHHMFHGEVPTLRQCVTESGKDEGETMMYERTIPTSMVFALMTYALQNNNFEIDVRLRVGVIFHKLLDMLCESPNVTDVLEIRILGGAGNYFIPRSNTFRSNDVWSNTACKVFEQLWHNAALEESRAWLNTTPNNMTVAAFTLFCIDVGFTQNASCLLAAGIDLVFQLAARCSAKALEALAKGISLKRSRLVGQSSRLRQGSKVSACFEACKMIVDQTALQQHEIHTKSEFQSYSVIERVSFLRAMFWPYGISLKFVSRALD